MLADQPLGGQLEVSVFSRGYGESIVVHVGEGRWIVIDSLVGENGAPVALSYLTSIGVDPASAIAAVLLTHWHDDHVGGAAQLVAGASSAIVALSSFIQKDEFKAFLKARGAPIAGTFGSGVSELLSVLHILIRGGRDRKWCTADKTIAADRVSNLYSFEALSPSERDFERFVTDLAYWDVDDARLPAPHRNDASVASVIAAQDELMLFGADLEIGADGSGWKAVHEVVWQSRGRASLFKVPHHGSGNADLEAVWADMLVENVVAALTPWNRGRKLPTQDDVNRITARTPNAHAAARPTTVRTQARLNAVEKSLRQAGIKVTTPNADVGHVRCRLNDGVWTVEYANNVSCRLADILAA